MINQTEADNRMRAHLSTTDRINRQAWRRVADRSSDRVGRAGARLEPRTRATFRGAFALRRAAGRLLALPLRRGAQPS
jgi:hypothetical protein